MVTITRGLAGYNLYRRFGVNGRLRYFCFWIGNRLIRRVSLVAMTKNGDDLYSSSALFGSSSLCGEFINDRKFKDSQNTLYLGSGYFTCSLFAGDTVESIQKYS